ncbi:tryptophan synthase subunit alpha [Verrucomicrobiota bacterium]
MNRIDKKFEELRKAGRKGLIGYLTAGDPDVGISEKNIRTAIENGLDILELGVPFSDPTADGPTIQEAAQRSLSAGMNLGGVLQIVKNLRKDFDLPIVLFGYVNPFFKYGYEEICADAAKAGVDGMLVVDLPFEQADELRTHMDKHNLSLIPLIAPTTPMERSVMILKNSSGFVYYIMVTGVTGARNDVASDIAGHVNELRECTQLPIAVGFGVSNGTQARQAGKSADAVVVGSALVKAAGGGNLGSLVSELSKALG